MLSDHPELILHIYVSFDGEKKQIIYVNAAPYGLLSSLGLIGYLWAQMEKDKQRWTIGYVLLGNASLLSTLGRQTSTAAGLVMTIDMTTGFSFKVGSDNITLKFLTIHALISLWFN